MVTHRANNLFVFHLFVLFLVMLTTVYGIRCWHTKGDKDLELVNWSNGELEQTNEECHGKYKYCIAILCPYRDASGVLFGYGGMALTTCAGPPNACDLVKQDRGAKNPCPVKEDMLCKTCEEDLCNTAADLLKDLQQTTTTTTTKTTEEKIDPGNGEGDGDRSGSRNVGGPMVMVIMVVALLNLFTGFVDH